MKASGPSWPDGAADPTALSPEQAARLLGIEARMLEQDIAAGAPANPDGTVNLVHYAAWLNLKEREVSDAEA